MDPGQPAIARRQFDGGIGVGAGAAALLKSVFQRVQHFLSLWFLN
jgi:hypothetical protein